MHQETDNIDRILADARTVAIVGLSSRPDRPSFGVGRYMQQNGYRIIPVNPRYSGTQILDEHCYGSLQEAAAAVAKEGGRIDIVDCFRKSEEVGTAVDDAIAIGARAVWMQLGVVDQQAAERAKNAGLAVVMDKCIKIEHMQMH